MLTGKKENNLQLYRHNEEIIAAVITQLEKDVLLCGGNLTLPPACNGDMELLKSEVQHYISVLSVKNPSLLFNLLYRIDIPQKMLGDNDLGTLVLKRELAKVLIRLSYS